MNYFGLTIRVQDFNVVAGKPELLKKLRKLTLASYSGMNYELSNFEKLARIRQVKCKILTAYNISRELIGWALLSEELTKYPLGSIFNPNDGYLFQVYVHPSHRKQGVGGALIKAAKRRTKGKNLCVAPHDEISHKFFNKFAQFRAKTL